LVLTETELLAGCGSYCGLCPNFLGEAEPRYAGCAATKGHPWWGECKVFSCVESHGVEYCGVCAEFPCTDLVNHYNPNNPQGQRNAVVRIGVGTFRAKYGDEEAVALVKKMGKPPSA